MLEQNYVKPATIDRLRGWWISPQAELHLTGPGPCRTGIAAERYSARSLDPATDTCRHSSFVTTARNTAEADVDSPLGPLMARSKGRASLRG
jgi:hypothetical protein